MPLEWQLVSSSVTSSRNTSDRLIVERDSSGKKMCEEDEIFWIDSAGSDYSLFASSDKQTLSTNSFLILAD